jgi:hypothetical protein
VIRHQHEGVQFIQPSVSASRNLFDDNVRQYSVDEKRVPFPSVCRHKIDAGLSDAPRDLRHISTARG